MQTLELKKIANEVRKGIITSVHSAKAGHPGGSLSAAELYTYLYFEEMNIDPQNPDAPDRDRFVLSKGHTTPGYYSVLAQRGFFPVEDLVTFRHVGSYLQGHPCMQHIPGVDMSSGSLGQGISAAVGMAISAKLTDDEYSEIKNHPKIGAQILSNATIFEKAIPIVKHHHERYDGFGYPEKLSGENIPIGGRCLAIADAFDAIVSRRPYKEPISIPEALEEIERNLGKQFDPEIGRTFIELVKSDAIGTELYE